MVLSTGRRTTRWTGAAVVCLLNSVIGSRLFLLAPPGQLDRSMARSLFHADLDETLPTSTVLTGA